ncbi:MAG: hypothetical protein V1781_10000 [Bacteroidota bacterium]
MIADSRYTNRIIIFLFFISHLLFLTSLHAQKVSRKEKNEILTEGLALYSIILANWTSNDLYYENEFNAGIVSGYLSYRNKDTVKTIFWREIDTTSAAYKASLFKKAGDTVASEQQNTKPEELRRIIKTIRYAKMNVKKQNAKISDEDERIPTNYEKMLIDYRTLTYNEMNKDTSFFIKYEGATLKAVPMDAGKKMKVFIYSGSNVDDVVPLGGDYLLVFDKKKNILEQKIKLHNNIIFISTKYRGKSYDDNKSSYHYHKDGAPNLITPTDIATILLYKSNIEWDEHHVISDKFTSIFTLIDRKLDMITTREYKQLKKKSNIKKEDTKKKNWH